MAFKAVKVKKGSFEVLGLEEYIEKTVRKLMGLAPAPAKAAAKPAAKPVKAAAPANGADPLEGVLAALNGHSKKAALIKAGAQKDQLLRSLIPLYVVGSANIEVSSGIVSKFWAKHGVTFAAPNAAKVLREHEGYAKRTKAGPRITADGVAYVEAALGKKR